MRTAEILLLSVFLSMLPWQKELSFWRKGEKSVDLCIFSAILLQ
jgi:hypothetical protein